tara:strand:- start:4197 stop:4571 length:375 start_codon:yes stop_codon:yes gene_type:complete
MKEKDLNQIAKLEKAIKDKYGKEAIQNPNSTWTKDKEQKYLEELKEFYKNKKTEKELIKIKEDTFIKNSKITERQKQICNICSCYSVSHVDDVYMTKFKCCSKCYIQYIEGREERWKSGWRPNS